MSFEMLLALAVFAIVTSITPGPNNFMLLASGVNFGFQRTIPHMLGIGVGFFVLLVAIGLGLGALLTAAPTVHIALKAAGAAYLLYLAWRIAMSRSLGPKGGKAARPMTFLEAAGFQWLNPKGWMIGITGIAVYTDPARPFLSMLLVAVVFATVNLPCISAWTAFGTMLRGFLADPARLRRFNIGMGVLLAATVWPMLR